MKNLKEKIIRKIKSKSFSALIKYGPYLAPEFLRKKIYMHRLKYPSAIGKDIVFKVADTREEFEQAFNLIYKEYLKLGYVEANDSEMYYKVHHALPESTVLIAKKEDKVIATISLIRDNDFGLPLESAFDLKQNAKHDVANKRIAEVCSFVIDPAYRRSSGTELCYYMIKYLYDYSKAYIKASYLFIAITPHHYDFYKFIFGFKKWNNKAVDYMGAPAINCYLALDEAPKNMTEMFGKQSYKKTFSYFYLSETVSNFLFPQRPFHMITDNYMSAEDVNYFFNLKSNLFESLDSFKLQALHLMYKKSEIKEVLPKLKTNLLFLKLNPRYEVECKTKFLSLNNEINQLQTTTVKNVSRCGLKLVGTEVKENTEVVLSIQIAEGQVAKVSARIVSVNQSENFATLKLTKVCSNWHDYINFLEGDFCHKISAVKSS